MYVIQYNNTEVMLMDSIEDLISSLTVELKRGTLVLSVLSQLRTPEYGYSLVQKNIFNNVYPFAHIVYR